MQKFIVFFVITILAFISMPLFAQYTNDKQGDGSDAPSGMVAKKVNNDVTVLMPKGGRMHKTNATTYVEESSDEYAARNFASIESRLNKLEKENREFREEINNIKSKLSVSGKDANL